MSLTYVPHEKISLKKSSEFNEVWLHDRICDNPKILGLGDVVVLDRERVISSGGRIDLILYNEDYNCRYEVEVMLGATDPSHIIRCIEYWDMERKRYPAYEHVAVLIAEDITSRFLNVMGLFAGNIPLIAIQLSALKINDNILLDFIRVLNQTTLREDDTVTIEEEKTDRMYWEKKTDSLLLTICDRMLAMINEESQVKQELNYRKQHIGLSSNGIVKNYIWFNPKPYYNAVNVSFVISNNEELAQNLDKAGFTILKQGEKRLRIRVTTKLLEENSELIRQVIRAAFQESWE